MTAETVDLNLESVAVTLLDFYFLKYLFGCTRVLLVACGI